MIKSFNISFFFIGVITLLFTPYTLKAQLATEVMLVGVTHAYPDRNPKRFEMPQNAVIAFAPQHIATEFMSPSGKPIALKMGTKTFRKKMKVLEQKNHYNPEKASAQIERLYQELEKEKNLNIRIRLAGKLYAHYDLANFYFQFYQIFKALGKMKPNLQNQWLQKMESFLFNKTENLTIANQLIESEFGNLIFPLALELGIERLHGIDDQTRYNQHRKAKQKVEKKLQKRLRLSERALRDLLWGKYDSLEYFAREKYEELLFLNSAQHDSLVLLAFEKQFTTGSFKALEKRMETWAFRNRKMAENILALAQQFPQERLVVFVGANHIPFLKEELSGKNNIKIINPL